jgi:transposase
MLRGLLTMSLEEVDRAVVIQHVIEKRMKQGQAAKQLGLSVRQVKRLVRDFRKTGKVAVISKRRGQPSNNRLQPEFLQQVRTLVETHYPDFGPTFAAEKLREVHQLVISKESLRRRMVEWGLWKAKRSKEVKVHQMRERRACFGELVQLDGSHHDWFEGRAPKCCLYVLIDDATSQLLGLHFEATETTVGYFRVVKPYIERCGRPLAFYSDKFAVFRHNRVCLTGEAITQFQRAMQSLDIELICANSSQAKGRVERVNGTLQDRLVKEMRLQGIASMEEANAFLPRFMADFNRRFAVLPSSSLDAHRRVLPSPEALKRIFSLQYEREISKNLEIHYDNKVYQLQEIWGKGYRLRYAVATVCVDLTGEITLVYKERVLAYVCRQTPQRATAVLGQKDLTAKLDARKTGRDAQPSPAPTVTQQSSPVSQEKARWVKEKKQTRPVKAQKEPPAHYPFLVAYLTRTNRLPSKEVTAR